MIVSKWEVCIVISGLGNVNQNSTEVSSHKSESDMYQKVWKYPGLWLETNPHPLLLAMPSSSTAMETNMEIYLKK